MGKRTRFQTEDKAQLLLEVMREGGPKEESYIKTRLPKVPRFLKLTNQGFYMYSVVYIVS